MQNPQEYPENLSLPADYKTLGGRLIRSGLGLLSIQGIVKVVTEVFLSPRREILLSDWKSWVLEKVREGGFWGFSKSYWTREALFLKRDPLGEGHTYLVKIPEHHDPTNPLSTIWVEGSNFGYFSRRGFLGTEASTNILSSGLSEKLVNVAEQEGLDFLVLGHRVTSANPVGRVCSLYFDKDCINIDLRDSGTSHRYALGTK